MNTKIIVEREDGNRTLRFETGQVAKQASGAVIATYGETTVMCTAMRSDPRPGLDFFPLQCDYRERTSAAGKFPGGFRKREGAPNEKEILTMRLMDRPIRLLVLLMSLHRELPGHRHYHPADTSGARHPPSAWLCRRSTY